uniref:Uncharacterized protein n=1 Tax=Timema genevievae TaxID=629358 RepID=A0A7R9JQG3_TIMGE|nr:unnamed protein product [Timema genevievae]
MPSVEKCCGFTTKKERLSALAQDGPATSCTVVVALFFLTHLGVYSMEDKLANAPVVLSQTTEDGEIEVRISTERSKKKKKKKLNLSGTADAD